ncbi:MAG: DUF2550 domain-containing protein [Gordonia sp. (in: high G+C Gram-positive bacteria)]
MPMWAWLLIAVVFIVGAVVAAALIYRVAEVRRAGTPVLFRRLPASADEGWRHGSVHYTDGALVYYRLTAMRPGPTDVLLRTAIEVTGRRAPEGTELEILDADAVILELTASRPDGSQSCEIGMNPQLVTAFQSWLEARAPSRTRRRRFRAQ